MGLSVAARQLSSMPGWREGGLTVGYETITDMEVVNMIADLCRNYEGKTDDIGLDAIAGIAPGGHFFGCDHTMARYRTEFYEHIVADLSNFGTWTENGAIDTHTRATPSGNQSLKLMSGRNLIRTG